MKLTGRTILIIDDSAHGRFLIVRALKHAGLGLSTHCVTGKEETAAYLDGHGVYAERLIFPYPSLVIIELEMPRGDGFSALLHLRQNPPCHLLPVLILSNSDDPGDMRTAYRLGATAYCIKPQNCAGILPILANFLNQRLPPDPAAQIPRPRPVSLKAKADYAKTNSSNRLLGVRP